MYEYSYVSYINNKMKADELSIKAGFSIKVFIQIVANEALRAIDRAFISKVFCWNPDKYHQTIREMKNAQQMVLGTILNIL